MRTRVFTVTPETWEEHRRAGVAAINDPHSSDPNKWNYATRQKVMTEVAGIRPGDRLFFYIQGPKHIIGGYEVTTPPFFDPAPIFPGASIINKDFPFRVGFRQNAEFARPIHVNEVWAGRDAGLIWTMQQARGDVVGRHACWALSKREGDLFQRMLNELNVVVGAPDPAPPLPTNPSPLPIDTKIDGVRYPHLNYEATVQTLILEGLADSSWRVLLGGYDDFLPYVPTSEGSEIDVVLLRHNPEGEILWYLILELKSDRFRESNLVQILGYETWLTSNQAGGNPRSVHMLAIANRFDEDVIDQVRSRKTLKQKPVRLLEYSFNTTNSKLKLSEVSI